MVQLFVHLILRAGHEPSSWRGVALERGQLVIGRKALSEETGIPEHQIRTCLKNLTLTKEITIKPASKYSIATICNYDTYQFGGEHSHQVNSQQINHQSTTNKKENNKKNKKESRKIIPPKVEMVSQYCDENSIEIDIDQYFDYYESVGWFVGKTKMKDWQASIRNWERNSKIPIRRKAGHRLKPEEDKKQKLIKNAGF